jgi:pilus assembly protein Flp/PilA
LQEARQYKDLALQCRTGRVVRRLSKEGVPAVATSRDRFHGEGAETTAVQRVGREADRDESGREITRIGMGLVRIPRGTVMSKVLQKFWNDEQGQGLVEYVLIIALVAIGLVSIMLIFRNSIGNLFSRAANTLDGAPGTQFQAS